MNQMITTAIASARYTAHMSRYLNTAELLVSETVIRYSFPI